MYKTLEQSLKPEVREKLEQVYSRGQYLLKSGLVKDDFSFRKELEDFYDLQRDDFSDEKYALERKPENKDKIGQIPSRLIRTLDGFEDNSVLTNIVNSEDELSYEKVRENFKPDTSYVNKKLEIIGHVAFLGLFAGMGGALYSAINHDLVELGLCAGVTFTSYVFITAGLSNFSRQIFKRNAAIKAIETMPEDKYRIRLGFWKLYLLSREADQLIKEYQKYF